MPVYLYLFQYEGKVSINNAVIDAAYCQGTLKSGTLLKANYTIDGKKDFFSILPLETTCEILLEKLKVDNSVLLKQEMGPFGGPSWTMISVDGGERYYGSDD